MLPRRTTAEAPRQTGKLCPAMYTGWTKTWHPFQLWYVNTVPYKLQNTRYFTVWTIAINYSQFTCAREFENIFIIISETRCFSTRRQTAFLRQLIQPSWRNYNSFAWERNSFTSADEERRHLILKRYATEEKCQYNESNKRGKLMLKLCRFLAHPVGAQPWGLYSLECHRMDMAALMSTSQ